MHFKIVVLALVACVQVAMTQRPTAFPLPSFPTGIPSFPFGAASFNNNWVRPYYAAAAEGWRTYFEQLQSARNQLYQTLTNAQNTAQNTTGTARDVIEQILSRFPIRTKQANQNETTQILGDLTPPVVEATVAVPQVQNVPQIAHDVPQEIQIVHTVNRPQVQVQPDVTKVRPQQVTVTHTVTQTQPNRPPQNVAVQGVATGTRPVTTQVTTSQVVPQTNAGVVPQLNGGVVPQVGSQIIPQMPAAIASQVASQIPSWVGK